MRCFWTSIALIIIINLPYTLSLEVSSTRTTQRDLICGYYNKKSYSSQEFQNSQKIISSYSFMSQINAELVLYKTDYTSSLNQTWLILIPHLIGLCVLIIIWPFLCCCCMYPEKYPSCQFFRKPQKQMYTKVQLKWTAYLMLLFYCIVVGSSIAAVIQAPNITDYYSNINCHRVSVYDDVIYGRISPSIDTRFFIGFNALSPQLSDFQSKIDTFFSQSSNSFTTANEIKQKQTVVQNAIQSAYTNYLDIVYNNAFSSDGVSYTPVNSDFKKSHYGPSDNSSTILGNIKLQLNTIFTQMNNAIDSAIVAWNQLSTLSKNITSTQINNTITAISNLTAELQLQLNYHSNQHNPQTYMQINSAMKAIYGGLIFSGLIGIICSILLTFCTVVRVRYIIYVSCGMIIFFGIFSFILLIAVAHFLPLVSQTCNYIDLQFSTSNSTILLQHISNQTNSQLFTPCSSDGLIMKNVYPEFKNTFQYIKTISNTTLQFNELIPLFTTQTLELPFTESKTRVDGIKNAHIYEIKDSISLGHLDRVSSLSYKLDGSCTSTNVRGDSWLQSFTLGSCSAGKFEQNPCSDFSDISICPLGCYEIMNSFQSLAGDSNYATNLANRYGSNTCNYYTYIINLQNNWNIPRKTQMQMVQTTLDNIDSLKDDYQTKVKAIQAAINTFKTILQSNFDPSTNLTSGAFTGSDCRPIGQTITDYRNAICVGLLNSLQYNFIVLLFICYAIIFLSIFTTCATVRHFKHLQKMQLTIGYRGAPISLENTRLDQKQ